VNSPQVLIVDDEPTIITTFSLLLRQDGYEVRSAPSAAAALQLLESWSCDVAFVDIKLGSTTGVDLLKLLRIHNPLLQVVLITGQPDVATAAEAVRLGVLQLPGKTDHAPRPAGRYPLTP